jgi:hypothetical protein
MSAHCTFTSPCEFAQNIINTLRNKLPLTSLKKLTFDQLEKHYHQELTKAIQGTSQELSLDTTQITSVLKIHLQKNQI